MPSTIRSDVDRVIGQNIRIARGRLQPPMTQQTLALRLGCSYQQAQKYETGHNSVRATTLREVAEITGQPLEFFFTEAASTEDHHLQAAE